MKRKDFVKLLEKNGWKFIREGHDHDIYGKDGQMEPVGRHRELSDILCKKIIKRRGLIQ